MSDENKAANPPACNHVTITRRVEPHTGGHGAWLDRWTCEGCGLEFIPGFAVAKDAGAADALFEATLDGIAGVFSATLWDLQERTLAKYGVKAEDPGLTPEDACLERGHDLGNDGVCKRCGRCPFL